MLRNCEEVCEQYPDFGRRIRRARAFLDVVCRQSVMYEGNGLIQRLSELSLLLLLVQS
jgi:hypothetical protein